MPSELFLLRGRRHLEDFASKSHTYNFPRREEEQEEEDLVGWNHLRIAAGCLEQVGCMTFFSPLFLPLIPSFIRAFVRTLLAKRLFDVLNTNC